MVDPSVLDTGWAYDACISPYTTTVFIKSDLRALTSGQRIGGWIQERPLHYVSMPPVIGDIYITLQTIGVIRVGRDGGRLGRADCKAQRLGAGSRLIVINGGKSEAIRPHRPAAVSTLKTRVASRFPDMSRRHFRH